MRVYHLLPFGRQQSQTLPGARIAQIQHSGFARLRIPYLQEAHRRELALTRIHEVESDDVVLAGRRRQLFSKLRTLEIGEDEDQGAGLQ